MSRTITFRARLLSDEHPPRTVSVRASTEIAPPATLRQRGATGSVSFDVYTLVDSDGWPQTATYLFVKNVAPDLTSGDV